jgi:Arc/MetJ-type ribon-helix-helix transcriptional regulator
MRGATKVQESTMTNRNVNSADELDRFVLAKVESGRYENASELSARRSAPWSAREKGYEARVAVLPTAIDAGNASGFDDHYPLTQLRKTLKLSKPKLFSLPDPESAHAARTTPAGRRGL